MNDSNVESLLKAILYGDPKYVVKPQSRVEALLLAIYESGGGGGGGDDTYTRAQIDAKIASCVPKVRKIATATLDKDISAAELASMLELSTTYVDQKNVTSNKTDVTSSGSKIPDAKAVYGFVGDATSKAVKFSACVYGANYNDFAETGFYEALGNSTDQTQNAPDGKNNDNNYYVITSKRDDQYTRQVAYSARVAGIIYTRVKTDNVWREWERIATDTVLNDYAHKTEISLVENAIKGTADGQFVTDENAVMTKTVPEKCKKGVVARISGKTRKTKNLFDGTYISGYYASNSSGTPKWSAADSKVTSIVVAVNPNTKYTVEKYDTSNRFQIVGWTAYPATSSTGTRFITYSDSSTEFTFTTSGTEKYISVMLSNDGVKPRVSVNEGDSISYEPYGELWSAPVESVVSSLNDDYINGHLGYDGSITSTNTYILNNTYIACKSGDTIKINTPYPYTYVAYYTSSKTFIDRRDWNSDKTIPSNAAFLRFDTGYATSSGASISPSNHMQVTLYVNDIKKVGNKTTLSVPKSIRNLPDYGLGVVKSDGTIVANEVDFENGVYKHNVSCIDLGSLEWEYNSASKIFYNVSPITTIKKPSSNSVAANCIAGKYTTSSYDSLANGNIAIYASGNGRASIMDSAYTTTTAFKTAMNGVKLVYELATPVVTPLSDIIFPFQCEAGGTVTLVNEHNIDMPNTVIYEKEVL